MNNFIVKEKTKEIFYSFKNIIKRPEMRTLPGQLAFYFVMSVVPIAAISAIIASFITKSYNFVGTVGSFLPPIFAKILTSLANNMEFNGAFFVIVLYVLLASNAPSSIIITSNVLYEIEQPNFIKRRVKSYVMTFAIVFLLLFVVLIPLFGDTIVKLLMTLIGNHSFFNDYGFIYTIIKVFGSFGIMYFIIKFLYITAPSEKIDRKTTTRGSLFTSISWIFATYIFAFYITRIASYDILYGNFASVLILLLWIYLLAYLFVIGMALNAEDFHKKKEVLESGKDQK